MGLGISVMALPIGACVGCTVGPIVTKAFNTPSLERKCCSFRVLLFPFILIVGAIIYVSLFLLCAKYDGVSVSTAITGEGSCWSTGGAMPYAELGMAAGTITGIGLTGCLWLIVALCRSPAKEKDQIQIQKNVAVDLNQDIESVVSGLSVRQGEGPEEVATFDVDVEQGSEVSEVTNNHEQGQGSNAVASDGEQGKGSNALATNDGLRFLLESISSDTSLSEDDKKRKIANFEVLLANSSTKTQTLRAVDVEQGSGAIVMNNSKQGEGPEEVATDNGEQGQGFNAVAVDSEYAEMKKSKQADLRTILGW
ncbi:hypothetical protein ACHAWT_007296 [Skeletonema menzelii]